MTAKTYKLGDIPVTIEYKNIKTLRMTVYPPDGRVCISAPKNAAWEFIRTFAVSKIPWIEKHREKFRRNAMAGNHFQNHEIHYVWGAPYKLELVERRGHPKIILEENVLRLHVRPDTSKDQKQKILDNWYRRLIRDAVPRFIEKWEPVIGVAVKGVYLRKMKSHWGSCNCRKQTIRLNTELAKKPPECLEYVIVHEMVHIIEPSHNRDFYRLMTEHLPAWKLIRKKMNAGEI
ncbi:MAG: M48 family metallopeptidase [Treponema sp.]|jgi:predicted metal-dependent hydrolase|nr:M48 family metallopeptidase [Treponema sp.]